MRLHDKEVELVLLLGDLRLKLGVDRVEPVDHAAPCVKQSVSFMPHMSGAMITERPSGCVLIAAHEAGQ